MSILSSFFSLYKKEYSIFSFGPSNMTSLVHQRIHKEYLSGLKHETCLEVEMAPSRQEAHGK
jgi:hypothetical protein